MSSERPGPDDQYRPEFDDDYPAEPTEFIPTVGTPRAAAPGRYDPYASRDEDRDAGYVPYSDYPANSNANYDPNYDRGGYQQGGYDQGYQQGGYDQGYQQGGYEQGYPQGGYQQGGYDQDPNYAPYAEPEPPRRSRTWIPIVAILALLALAGVIIGVTLMRVAGPNTTTAAPPSSAAGSTSAKAGGPATTAPKTTGTTTAPTSSAPTSAPATGAAFPAGSKECSATVAAGGATSCEFANNVAAAAAGGQGTSYVVKANSPVTNKDYDMTCVVADLITCTGGNNAQVFIKKS